MGCVFPNFQSSWNKTRALTGAYSSILSGVSFHHLGSNSSAIFSLTQGQKFSNSAHLLLTQIARYQKKGLSCIFFHLFFSLPFSNSGKATYFRHNFSISGKAIYFRQNFFDPWKVRLFLTDFFRSLESEKISDRFFSILGKWDYFRQILFYHTNYYNWFL